MSLSAAFWILMLLGLVLGVWSAYPFGNGRAFGGTLILFLLLAILGWKVFGGPIH